MEVRPLAELTCTVDFAETSATDDPVHGEVVHGEVHVELEIFPLAVPRELVALEELRKNLFLQLVAYFSDVRLNRAYCSEKFPLKCLIATVMYHIPNLTLCVTL